MLRTPQRLAVNIATAGSEYRSINVLGGSDINSIDAGVVGATIAGGGWDFFGGLGFPNRVTAYFGTVGGGDGNAANAYAATVAGGQDNTASGNTSTIGGGDFNTASGHGSTIAGGYFNKATGAFSFAAGFRAQANHDGTFVWGDSTDANFASTAPNQFLIRATGGIGINTNDTNNGSYALNIASLGSNQVALHVSGTTHIAGILAVDNTLYASSGGYITGPLDVYGTIYMGSTAQAREFTGIRKVGTAFTVKRKHRQFREAAAVTAFIPMAKRAVREAGTMAQMPATSEISKRSLMRWTQS